MKDRIKKVRADAGINQAEFGKRISISRSAVWKLENGENTPSEQTVRLICKEFGVSYLWLTEGIEPMKEALDTDSMTRIDAIMTGENEFAKSVFREFSKLSETQWNTVKALIERLSDSIKNE